MDRAAFLKAMERKKSAKPSEPIAWSRIGVPDRRCRLCGRKLVLADVAHFGTDYRDTPPSRFVECAECFLRPAE